jgi:hypothetical protein
VWTYKKNALHHKLDRFVKLKSFYHEGVFYCFVNLVNTNQVDLTLRNEDEFFGALVSDAYMYEAFSD